MEKIIICAVFDKKANEFQAPFGQANKVTACRGFMLACKDENNLFAKFPEDYCLYKLGVMDVKSGEFKNEKELLLEAANVTQTVTK